MTKPNPEIEAVLALLVERWPKCFSIYERRRRPLKIGIHHDILAALDGAITALELGRALGVYTANAAYLRSLQADAVRINLNGDPAGARIDLNGNPAGVVTADQAEHAKASLMARNKARAGSKPSQPKATPSERLSLADLKGAAIARRLKKSNLILSE